MQRAGVAYDAAKEPRSIPMLIANFICGCNIPAQQGANSLEVLRRQWKTPAFEFLNCWIGGGVVEGGVAPAVTQTNRQASVE